LEGIFVTEYNGYVINIKEKREVHKKVNKDSKKKKKGWI